MTKSYSELMIEYQKLNHEIRLQRLYQIRRDVAGRRPAPYIKQWLDKLEELVQLRQYKGEECDELLTAIEENL